MTNCSYRRKLACWDSTDNVTWLKVLEPGMMLWERAVGGICAVDQKPEATSLIPSRGRASEAGLPLP